MRILPQITVERSAVYFSNRRLQHLRNVHQSEIIIFTIVGGKFEMEVIKFEWNVCAAIPVVGI
jgi:hypothetical protein